MRRSLALVLAFHVTLPPGRADAGAPVAADDPHSLHQRGGEFRALGQHLEAARQWLRALDTVELEPSAVLEVHNHFCEAMESLTAAVDQRGQAREVRQELDTRHDRLEASAELLRRHAEPADTATCLDRWQTLARLPGAPTPSQPLPTDTNNKPPPPPTDRAPRGQWAGLGVSLAGVGVGAVMLGVGGRAMKEAYDDAKQKWNDSGQTRKIQVCGDNGGETPDGVAPDCDRYHSQRYVAAIGAGVLAAALVSTVVFASLLGRHRAQRLAVSGTRLPGGVLLQAAWRF